MPLLGGNSNVEINIKVNSDTKGVDEAKTKVEGFGGSLERIGEIAAGIGLARLGEQFLEFGKQVSMFAINTAADFEQWKVSFDTMIGDSTKASKLLKEISDFAIKTPFDLPQVIEGSKRLLAYNIEAEKIIPTFEMLGNIAAGVGTEKLPQLILAFGQVRAATKLTGAELRQFTEAGVPMLQALVDKANEQGGVLTKVGGLTKQQGKEMSKLTSTIVEQEFRMKLLTDANKNNGTSWTMLQHKYDQNKQKLAEFGAVGEASYVRVKATAADMIQKISDGEVKFEDVQAALEGMTGKGGRFFELMDKQALTFNGTLSNMRDQMVRVAAEIMGVEMTDAGTFGEIKKGSLFDQLRIAAQQFLDWVNAHKDELVSFFRAIGTAIFEVVKALGTIVTWLGALFDWLYKVEENSKLVSSALIALSAIVTALALVALPAAIEERTLPTRC
jgi:tape measure domain-containing protein